MKAVAIPVYIPELTGVIGGGGIFADVDYSALDYIADEENAKDSHIHSFCEVYFNISGDMAFAVENNLYQIESGDIVITKPNEFHRCIYRSDCTHEHFVIWVNGEENMLPYLKCFFERKNGEGNLIRLSKENRERFKSAVSLLVDNKGYGKFTSSESLSALFSILSILEENRGTTGEAAEMPENFSKIVRYIDKNYTADCSVKTITDIFYISRSSLNRNFKLYLGTTPSKYVETRRLAAAKALLEKDEPVQDAATKCGFSDYSHFISLFRRRFGMTPHKYRKMYK